MIYGPWLRVNLAHPCQQDNLRIHLQRDCARDGQSDVEIHALIFYLHEHRDRMSGGGFKDVVWTGLGKLLADKHHVSWSHSSMKSKFSVVCNFL